MKRALSILAAGLLLSACGISGNLRYHPGFAAFGSLPLKIARVLTKHDPEISTMLRPIVVVRDDGELVQVLVRAGLEDRVRGPENFNAFMTELDIEFPALLFL
jgi:hypothetical protein